MFEEFGVIKKNSRVAINGADTTGTEIKKFIEQNRPDLKIVFFVDLKKTGEYEGIELIQIKDLPEKKELFDFLIVSTRRNAPETLVLLNYLDIPFLMISRTSEWSSNGLPYFGKYKQALSVFKTNEDKFLYNLLWETYCSGYYEKLEKFVQKKYGISKYQPVRNYNAQYVEYINRDAIKTIVDGGFCNGINSFAFKKHLKNLERIYAFEPLYEKFKNENYDYFIQQADFVTIIPKALWNKTGKIEFCENIPYHSASRVLGTKGYAEKKPHENIVEIETTTIDEAKKDYIAKKIDFIKLDIEGAETQALHGAENTFKQERPQLAVSIYHSMDDFVSIPVYLNEILQNYTFRIGHYSYDLNETILYAIPDELLE